jgi:hypothetical protein
VAFEVVSLQSCLGTILFLAVDRWKVQAGQRNVAVVRSCLRRVRSVCRIESHAVMFTPANRPANVGRCPIVRSRAIYIFLVLVVLSNVPKRSRSRPRSWLHAALMSSLRDFFVLLDFTLRSMWTEVCMRYSLDVVLGQLNTLVSQASIAARDASSRSRARARSIHCLPNGTLMEDVEPCMQNCDETHGTLMISQSIQEATAPCLSHTMTKGLQHRYVASPTMYKNREW